MSLSRIWTILRKDLVDAIRDGRVLAVILIPIGLGLMYGALYPDEEPRPTADVVIVGSGVDAQRVAEAFPRDVRRALEVTVERDADERRARETVADDDADVAVVVPDGLLDRAAAGRAPPLTMYVGSGGSPTAQAVLSLLPTTVERLAERPATVDVRTTAVTATNPAAVDAVGLRTYFVLSAIVMLIGFVGMLVVPIILAEEIEKRTLEALLLAARGPEVMAAKVGVGLVYSAVATLITVLLTGITVERPALFVLGVAGTALSVVGLGLVMAYLFRSADKLNTWGWVVLMPFLAPAFLAGVPGLPGWAETLVQILPTGQGMRMMVDGALSTDVFGDVGIALALFVAWAAAGLGLLGWILQRRGA